MTERFGFTEKRIKDLEPTPGKQVEYFDTADRLFGVRVSPGGRKTFFVKKRVHGRLHRVCLGNGAWPEVSVLKAREEFHKALATLRTGVNPNLDKKRRTAENSDKSGILSAVYESYLAASTLKPVTKRGYGYNFKYLKAWENKRVEDITPGMVKERFDEIATIGEFTANRVIGLLKCLMAHSMKTLKRPAANPVNGIEWKPEPPRRINVAPEMMPAFIAALDNVKGDSGSELYKLLLFTGLRKSNAMELKWSKVDLDKRTLYVAETKNGEPLYIPLSGFVVDLLKARKEKTQGSAWVFPSHSRTGHIMNTSNFDQQIVAQGVKVSPHILRKRFTTTAKLLCPGFVVDILTSHIPTGSVTDKNYTIPSPEELRPFTEQITSELLRMAGVKCDETSPNP
jgi:integrase